MTSSIRRGWSYFKLTEWTILKNSLYVVKDSKFFLTPPSSVNGCQQHTQVCAAFPYSQHALLQQCMLNSGLRRKCHFYSQTMFSCHLFFGWKNTPISSGAGCRSSPKNQTWIRVYYSDWTSNTTMRQLHVIKDCIIPLSFWHWCMTWPGHTMVHFGSHNACNIHLGVEHTVANSLEHSVKNLPHPLWFSAYRRFN